MKWTPIRYSWYAQFISQFMLIVASCHRSSFLIILGRSMWFCFSIRWISHSFVPLVGWDFLLPCQCNNWTERFYMLRLDVYWSLFFFCYDRDNCFQWPIWRISEVKYRSIGCFNRQCGKLVHHHHSCITVCVWMCGLLCWWLLLHELIW